MLSDLHTLLATPWIRPRGRLLEAVEILSRMNPDLRSKAVDELAMARGDTAPALWLAERAREVPFRPRDLVSTASDLSWAEATALELVDAEVVGIVSMGETTRVCLAALADIRSEPPIIRAGSGVIGRGVDDLAVGTEVGDPATADRCLVPIAAMAVGGRMWTSSRGADVVRSRADRVVVLDDPIRRLGDWALARWRPPDWLMEMSIPR